VGKFKCYWVWIEGKPGLAPHELHAEIERHGFILARSTQTWSTALSYLRDYMRAGFIVSVYEVEE
jgi:hypothetical protein